MARRMVAGLQFRAIFSLALASGFSISCGDKGIIAPSALSVAVPAPLFPIGSAAPSGAEFFRGVPVEGDVIGHVAGPDAPGAPGNLTVAIEGNFVTLRWAAPTTGDPVLQYIIEVGVASGTTIYTINTQSTALVFTGLAPNGTFYVRVRGRNIDASGAVSTGPASNETVLVVPSGGTGVSFRVVGPLPEGRVGVPYFFSFCGLPNSNGANCQGTGNPSGGSPPYHFQLDSAGGFPPFGLTVGVNGNLTGTPSVAGSRTFRVCAVDLGGNQACDNATVTIVDCQPPPAPTGLTASVSGNTVTVRWNASAGATSYVIEAGGSSGTTFLTNDVGAQTSVTSAASNGTYYVRVRARSDCGTSVASAEVVVQVGGTAPPPPPPPPTTRPTVSPATQDLGEAGGCPGGTLRATVNVTAPPNVTWTASHFGSSIVSWARLSFGPMSGTGSGAISVSIELPPQRPHSGFTCSDYFRFQYGDTIQVRFSTNDVASARITYTYLSVY